MTGERMERFFLTGHDDEPPEIMADIDKGTITAVGYVLRAQDGSSKADRRGQKLDRQSFERAVAKAAKSGGLFLWDHAAQGGADDAMGTLQWGLDDTALRMSAEVVFDPAGLVKYRMEKIRKRVVPQMSIAFFRDWASTESRRVAQAGEKPGDGEKLVGDLIVRKQGYVDTTKGEWEWFRVAELLECSAVMWGVDPLTAKSAVVQSLQSGTRPELDTTVAYMRPGDDVARFGLVLANNDGQVLISDIADGKRTIRPFADCIPVTQALIAPPIPETKTTQEAEAQSATPATIETQVKADTFDWSAVTIPN